MEADGGISLEYHFAFSRYFIAIYLAKPLHYNCAALQILLILDFFCLCFQTSRHIFYMLFLSYLCQGAKSKLFNSFTEGKHTKDCIGIMS